MTRADALERILGMARRRGFDDGRKGTPSLVERAASPRELVAGMAAAAGGGLLKVGESEQWAPAVATAYSKAYRSGDNERRTHLAEHPRPRRGETPQEFTGRALGERRDV